MIDFLFTVPKKAKEKVWTESWWKSKHLLKHRYVSDAEFRVLSVLYNLHYTNKGKYFSYIYLKTQPKTLDLLAKKSYIKLTGAQRHLARITELGCLAYMFQYYRLSLEKLKAWREFNYSKDPDAFEIYKKKLKKFRRKEFIETLHDDFKREVPPESRRPR